MIDAGSIPCPKTRLRAPVIAPRSIWYSRGCTDVESHTPYAHHEEDRRHRCFYRWVCTNDLCCRLL